MSDKELVLGLLDLMFEANVSSNDDATNYIREMGEDPNVLVKKGLAIIAKFKAELLRAKARKKLEFFRNCWEKFTNCSTPDQKRKVLTESFRSQAPQLALVFNRRLEKFTDGDIESLDSEIKLLDFLSEFIDEGDKEGT